MKRITIPKDAKEVPIEVTDESGEKRTGVIDAVPFSGFVCNTLLNASTWSTKGETPAARTKTLRLSFEIQEKFEGKKPGAKVDLSEDAWDALVESLDPGLVRGTRCARALMDAGFWSAIEEPEQFEELDEDDTEPAKPAPKKRASSKANGKSRKKKSGGKGRRKRARP